MQTHQICNRTNFACGMSQKCIPNLRSFNPIAVICNPNKLNTTLFNFNSNRMGACIHGIFHQLFHDTGWALHDFACSDFVNRVVVKHMNLCHICSRPFLLIKKLCFLVLSALALNFSNDFLVYSATYKAYLKRLVVLDFEYPLLLVLL